MKPLDGSPGAGSPSPSGSEESNSMKIPKPLFYGVLATLFAAWFGLIGPAMISADSDALVIGWILLTIAGAVYAFHKLQRKKK